MSGWPTPMRRIVASACSYDVARAMLKSNPPMPFSNWYKIAAEP